MKLPILLYSLVLLTFSLFPLSTFADDSIKIPILCYHNFSPDSKNSMTMTPDKFESQMKWFKENGYTFISLKEAVEYLQGTRKSLPSKPVVITADDGWRSNYKYLYPIAKKFNMPVTLFIYPQTISSGKNAMTWDELKELQKTGLFDVQGHTYSHPNFKQEKRRLSSDAYEKFVQRELAYSKKLLEEKMGTPVSFLAWPFGIYNPYLEQQAAKAGYVMAFSIDDRKAKKSDNPMSQPRFMILDGLTMKTFTSKMGG